MVAEPSDTTSQTFYAPFEVDTENGPVEVSAPTASLIRNILNAVETRLEEMNPDIKEEIGRYHEN